MWKENAQVREAVIFFRLQSITCSVMCNYHIYNFVFLCNHFISLMFHLSVFFEQGHFHFAI